MADIKIDFEGEELDITYELVKGEEQSDIAGSSDQINLLNIECEGFDCTDRYWRNYTRIEEIIFEQTK